MAAPAMPRWFWLLPLLALAAWWPREPYWQSDDFFALHYAQHLGNVLRDFVGPQYGASDVWFFYRPLITASLWLEQCAGGPSPFLSHLVNVLAHATSALLAACVWRRFLRPDLAFAAAALWALLPAHQGSIAWTVGRVDSHTTVWILLAVLVALRAQERQLAGGGPPRWPLAVATGLALLSKESALVLPALATAALWPRTHGTLRQRLGAALTLARPAWLVLALYLPWRLLVLGRFGGYAAAGFDPATMLTGLGRGLANLAVPLRWVGAPADGALPATLWLAAAAAPVVVAVLIAAVRMPRLVVAAVGVAALALLPIANFLSFADNPQTLRLYYLPTIAWCGLLAAGGRLTAVAIALAWAAPFVAMRGEQLAADRESAAMHRAMLREAADGAESPMFVAGLPRTNRSGTAVQLHFGVDRLLRPPFAAGATALYALRPLDASPAAFRLFDDGEAPFVLGLGSTWSFADASALVRAHRAPDLPDLRITGDRDGVVDLTTPRLDALLPADGPRPQLRTPGVRPQVFRLTVFTATGYLATLFFDHAEGGDDGLVDFRRWLAGSMTEADRTRVPPLSPLEAAQKEAARYGGGGSAFIGEALGLPATMDLEPAFPLLLEAGTVDLATFRFTPTHRARRPLTLRLDRGYEGWRRRAQG